MDQTSITRSERAKLNKASRQARAAEEAPHGTLSGYQNWGCRCDPCKAAGAEKNRLQRAYQQEWARKRRLANPNRRVTRTLADHLEHYTVTDGGCWRYSGYVRPDGYVRVQDEYLHRVAFQSVQGPIPAGLTVDHTCHNADPTCVGGYECLHRRCINPAHLEAVPLHVNVQRAYEHDRQRAGRIGRQKTHCKRGHEFTPENTRQRPTGRECRECIRVNLRNWRSRQVAS